MTVVITTTLCGTHILDGPNVDICYSLPNSQMLCRGDPSPVGTQSFDISNTLQKGCHDPYPVLKTLLEK